MDIPSYLLGRIKGSGGAGVNYVVVDELPTVGEEGTIYLVPKSTSKTDNVYNEYMYIEDEWELIGDTQADLTDYVKNTDYATSQTAGVIKSQNSLNFGVNESGIPYAENRTYAQYQTQNNTSFIGKGTLENVINGKGLITQYETLPTASADNLGKIVQYIGTTDSTYTNGYYYKCIGTESGGTTTYSWENIQVQAGNSKIIIIEDSDDRIDYISINTTANKEALGQLLTDYTNIDKYTILYKKATSSSNVYKYLSCYSFRKNEWNEIELQFLIRNETSSGNASKGRFLGLLTVTGTSSTISGSIYKSWVIRADTKDDLDKILFTDNTTAYTPTGNYNPATKKYVDDSIASAIGTALQGNY